MTQAPLQTGKHLLSRVSAPLAAALPLGAIALHAPAWAQLLSEYSLIRGATSPEDLQAVTQFWLLFAVSHPIVGPLLSLAEVVDRLPGPQLVGTPVLSIAVATALLSWLARSPPLRRLVLGLTLAGFLEAVGAGVEGTANLGDYNLALNDGLRGCPTYEQVRQPSMDGFDLTKYQGRWYELAFHDYTQFHEVYDTTFDIALTADGRQWLDDFTIKGPSPRNNPISYDRSPVANGAHYFLYGKVDPATSGVLQESGFGVVFPNYIVDVQRDAEGQYTEAIQFQCLERGGVRIFEGINFLARTPAPGPARLEAMFQRAEGAGLAPYGATPTQMHVVEHAGPNGNTIDNAAQRFWRLVGVEKLLALLEEGTPLGLDEAGPV